MSEIFGLLPLVLAFALVASFTKLAARILRGTLISWKSALLFSLILFVLTTVKFLSGLSFSTVLPPVMAILVGIAITLSVGSWFFSSRATTAEGSKVGWLGGLKLTSLSLCLMLLIVIPFVLLARVLLPAP